MISHKKTDEIWTIFGLTNGKTCDIIISVVRERQQKLKNRIGMRSEVEGSNDFLMGVE